MARTHGPLQRLTDWITAGADGSSGMTAAHRLAARHPALAGYRTVGELVRSAWADSNLAGELLVALVDRPCPDGLADQTALAILAPRLRRVLGRWARGGVLADELDDLEADLIVEILTQLRSGPSDPTPGRLVDAAWGRVRGARRRHQRRQSRTIRLAVVDQILTTRRVHPAEETAGLIVDAVRSRRLSLATARAVYVTGVAGWPVSEAANRLGIKPDALRARRSRAVRALAA